jgi:hypothetical protein
LIRGIIYSFTLLLGFYLVITTAEFFGHFNSGARTILFYLFIGGMLFVLGKFVINPLLHLYRYGKIISHEQAAEILGKHFSTVKDKLLNVLQLKKQSDDNFNISSQLLFASIDQKITELKPIPFVSAINLSENRRYLRYAILPLGVFVILLFTAPSLIKDSTQRLMQHNTYFEKPAPFSFVLLNKDLKTVQKQDYEISVRIKGDEIPAEAYIEIEGNQFKLNKETVTDFNYVFRNIQKSETFKFFADGFYSEEYTLEALPNPILTNFKIKLEYPAYLHKQNESLQNTGDLLIPQGTWVRWNFNTQNTESIHLAFSDSSYSLTPASENSFTFSKRFMKNDSYVINTGNHFLNSKDSMHYAVNVIPDLYPTISVEQQRDSLSSKRTFFKGLVKDDYGFSKLTFNFRFLKSNDTLASAPDNKGKLFSENIVVSKNMNTDQFFYSWDLATVNIYAGDEVEYYFEVWDNDGISGPKSTRSQSLIFKAPNLKEIEENSKKSNEEIKNDLQESISKAKQMQKEMNDFSKKLLEKKEMSWEDKKKAEDLMNKHKELEKKLEELRSKNEQKNREEQEYKKINEDIAKKQEQLQNLMDKLQSPELQKLLEQLQQLMQNVDRNQMQEQLSQMKLDNKDLQKELERTIELFKEMEFEQKLQENIDKLDELAKKEDSLSRQTDNKSKDNKELKSDQDNLNKNFDDFRKDMDDLAKKNDELEDKKNLENTDQQEQDIENEMQNSSDQLEQNKGSKASKSQKSAAQKMKEMSDKMKSMQQQMAQEENEEDMNALRALLENLLRLSFDQEAVMQKLKTTDINNPQYLKLSQEQQKLKR